MKAINSFAKTVKEEIVSKEYSNERLLSILSAFVRINGSLVIKGRNAIVVAETENSKIAKFVYTTINNLFGFAPSISYSRRSNLSKGTKYRISIGDADAFLEKLKIDFLEGKISKEIVKNDEMIGGYLAGAFLASGSVNSPRSTNYHLEIVIRDENYASWFIKLINKYHDGIFTAKRTTRRDKNVIYLKRSDLISDFLVLIGATESCLYFENIRIDRDFANVGNRLQNMDTANYEKSLKTAYKDIKIINGLIDKVGLKGLGNEKTVLLCILRVEHPEFSMDELATLLSKELKNPVSKSYVNHQLRAIREMGRKLHI